MGFFRFGLFQKWDPLFRREGAKTEGNEGAPKACLGPANYSEGKVPAPRRLGRPVSEAREGRRRRRSTRGLRPAGSAGWGGRRAASGAAAGRATRQAAVRARRCPTRSGRRVRARRVGEPRRRASPGRSCSRSLAASLARRRSRFLPLAHTDTRPTSPQLPLRRTHSPAFP